MTTRRHHRPPSRAGSASPPPPAEPPPPMSPGFRALFEQHAAASLDKQLHLADVVGEQGWRADLPTATIGFGPQSWSMQVLGSESQASGTWLWAWANPSLTDKPGVLKAATALRAFGEQRGIPELTTPQIRIGDVNGHVLGMVAAGVCQGDAYYRGPYDGGALVMLIKDAAFPRSARSPAIRISIIFPQLIAQFAVDHRRALLGYLGHYRMQGSAGADAITASDATGAQLTARFDPQGRLADMQVQATGAP